MKEYECILLILMDLNRTTIIELLTCRKDDLTQRGVKTLALFGSLARGEATSVSDIDILVEFSRPVGLFEFIRLKIYLEQITGRSVDLVTPDAIRPVMKNSILNEAIYVR